MSASPSSFHFVASSTWPAISMPSGSSSSGSTSSAVGPATVSRAGTPTPRSASNARSSTGRPLRSSARPTKTIRRSSCGREPSGPGRGQVHPVRDDAVAAAVVALRGPLRRLGHGDARAQLGVQPPRADEARREAVREPAGRVGVERGDHRSPGGLGGVPDSGTGRSARARGRRRSRRGGARGRAGRRTWGRSRGSTPRRSSAGRACGPSAPRDRAGAAAAAVRRDELPARSGRRGRRAPAAGRRVPAPSALGPEPPHGARHRPDTCRNRA